MKEKNILSDFIISSRCEINSGNSLVIFGCKKVLTYENEFIKIAFCDMVIEIKGKNLSIKSYFTCDIEIVGVIDEIHFTERRGKNGKNN